MIKTWLHLLDGSTDDDLAELIRGQDPKIERLVRNSEEIGQVANGVVRLNGASNKFGQMEITAFRKQGWIPRNWKKRASLEAVTGRAEFCDLIADSSGTMMEIAIGPGGGFFPNILLRNPNAKLLLNDISIPVLEVWKELLDEAAPEADFTYFSFDFTKPVMKAESLDAVFGALPFSSTSDVNESVAQAYRSLRVGGIAYIEEQIVRGEDWERVPVETRIPWEKRNPALMVGIADVLSKAGFVIDEDKRFPGHLLDPDAGGLARSAHEHGVSLNVERNMVIAQKP